MLFWLKSLNTVIRITRTVSDCFKILNRSIHNLGRPVSVSKYFQYAKGHAIKIDYYNISNYSIIAFAGFKWSCNLNDKIKMVNFAKVLYEHFIMLPETLKIHFCFSAILRTTKLSLLL